MPSPTATPPASTTNSTPSIYAAAPLTPPATSAQPAPASTNSSSLLASLPELRSTATADSSPDLSTVWPIVDTHIRKGEITEALKRLSGYYRTSLSADDRTELLRYLDALARKVIYSTEHHLVPTPHVVQAGETIESIAKQLQIPANLLMNINRSKIPASNQLSPGLELKVVQGPFRAEIDTEHSELTLFLGQLYAGRFAVDTTCCKSIAEGECSVQNLSTDSAGQMRLMLSNGVTICSNDAPGADNTIRLSAADTQDVCGILMADSQVTIVR